LLRILAQLRLAAANLGFKNYVEARERISGLQYEKILNGFEEVLNRLEDKFFERFRVSVEATIGIPFAEVNPWDIAHWEEKNDQLQVFSRKGLLGVVESTISEMSIRPERSGSISLDLDSRIGKQPRASCIPIKIPDEIKIVMTPRDGSRCYASLLHEYGHAYHFAWTNPSLPAEHRYVGDRALSEAYAFLLEHFMQEWEWLARMLHFNRPEQFLRFRALHRIFLIRQCAGRLRFAIKLHESDSFGDAPQLYSETMKMYTGLQHPPEFWMINLADSFAAADYLRGWAFEALLREYLCTKYGNAWAVNRSASAFLKEIWETGFLYRADELCREIGIGELEPQMLADKLWEGLQE